MPISFNQEGSTVMYETLTSIVQSFQSLSTASQLILIFTFVGVVTILEILVSAIVWFSRRNMEDSKIGHLNSKVRELQRSVRKLNRDYRLIRDSDINPRLDKEIEEAMHQLIKEYPARKSKIIEEAANEFENEFQRTVEKERERGSIH